jgi:hypothetical protein
LDQYQHVTEKVIVLDGWLLFDEILDLDYDVVHALNEYHDDDYDYYGSDHDDYDMEFVVDVLD